MAEPAQRRTADDGGKFYEHPTRIDAVNGGPRLYNSVTTVLDIVYKDGLKYWSSQLAARRAMDNLPKMLASQRVEPCGRAYARTEPYPCDECPECVQRWIERYHIGEASRRAREGSATHDVFGWWIVRGEWPDMVHIAALQNQDETKERIEPADFEPYVEQLKQFLADYGLSNTDFEAAEMTVWNHTHGYAGTLDAIVRIKPTTRAAAKLCARIRPLDPLTPVVVVMDCKTREKPDKEFWQDYPLQLAPYRHAETAILGVTKTEVPMPKTDGACILQLRPGSYSFEPVLSEVNEFQAFLSVLGVYRWSQQRGADSIAVRTFQVPDGWKYVEGAYVEPDAVAGPESTTSTEAATAAVTWAAPPTKAAPAKKAAPRKAAAKSARPEFAPRAASATLDSLTDKGRRASGSVLRDEDIPF